MIKKSSLVKAFTKRSSTSSSEESDGTANKKTFEATNTNEYVVVDGESAVTEECDDELLLRLRREALEVAEKEPMVANLLAKVGLLSSTTNNSTCKNIQPAKTFEQVISRIVSHRLISSCSGGTQEGNLCPTMLLQTIHNAFLAQELELGHTMSEAVRADALAVVKRDPACETLLEVVLFMKGFASLVIHRAARREWKPDNDGGGGSGGRRFAALLLQSQASSAFGVDIHPAAQIGAGVMFDHASGIVVGETAIIGDGTTILHGVTLGGTGKENGDRHPKVGKDVLIGAGTKILGNIHIGDRVKIGAGSVVLRAIPSGATAVGAPARIIGFTPTGERPGSDVDTKLADVEPLSGGMADSLVGSTITKSTTDTSLSTVATDMQNVGISVKRVESSSSASSEDMESGGGSTDGDEADEKKVDILKKEAMSKKVALDDSKKDEDSSQNDEDEEVDEEDDKITDFGTPARCFFAKMSKDDGLCPFSGSFRKSPRAHSEDWISHSKLQILLVQQGCSDGECVEVFFELLHLLPIGSTARKYGCIPVDVFSENFVDIAQKKTSLDLATCQAMADGDLRALGLSKKASKRFKGLFSTLGQKSTRALSRIPSASDLLPTKKE